MPLPRPGRYLPTRTRRRAAQGHQIQEYHVVTVTWASGVPVSAALGPSPPSLGRGAWHLKQSLRPITLAPHAKAPSRAATLSLSVPRVEPPPIAPVGSFAVRCVGPEADAGAGCAEG